MTKQEGQAWVAEVNRMQKEFRETDNAQHETIQQQDNDIDELLVVIGGGVINEQVLSED